MASPARRYSFSVFTVDLRARKLWRGTTLVPLPARAFDALAYLIARPGRPIEKNEIIAAAWRDVAVTDDSLIHAISVLRRALGDEPTHPSIIETIPRFGYRFVGTVEPCADDGSWPPGSTPRAGAPRRSLNTIRLAAS
jgi:DNA-binding winged helix-turn-helix (wHTH) protein